MKNKKLPNWAMSLRAVYIYLALHLIAYYFLSRQGPRAVELLNSIAPILVGMFASGAAAWAWRGSYGNERRIWMWLCFGNGIWTLAEIWWMYFIVFADEVPYPSGADVLWVLGYLPVGIAIILYAFEYHMRLNFKKVALALLAGGVLPVALFLSLIPPSNSSQAAQFITEAVYPPLDLILATGGFLCMLSSQKRLGQRPWLLIGFSLVIDAYADIWYWLLTFWGVYSTDLFSAIRVDIPYALTYVIMGVGCLQAGMQVRLEPKEVTTPLAHLKQGK